MKLIFCPKCLDVFGLITHEWRQCLCKKSGGQYNIDRMTATIGGSAQVFGIGNPFFYTGKKNGYPRFASEEVRSKFIKKYYGHTREAWWGEYPGERQIFRIKSSKGPRIKLKFATSINNGMNIITVLDKRKFLVDKRKRMVVEVPVNTRPAKKGTR